jgi:hypothetical protein
MNDKMFADIVGRQFGAALEMLRNAIVRCPNEVWARRDEREAPFWQHAVHVLFYTRLFFFDSMAAAAAAGTGGKVMKLIGLPLKDTSEAEINRMVTTIGYNPTAGGCLKESQCASAMAFRGSSYTEMPHPAICSVLVTGMSVGECVGKVEQQMS